jgi:hypothetical protein
MILTGYLAAYAQEFPLAISASIALEQSYGYVDGDSASLGEACTLISALSKPRSSSVSPSPVPSTSSVKCRRWVGSTRRSKASSASAKRVA